jgi:S-formylglutathione hydrolase FrmB
MPVEMTTPRTHVWMDNLGEWSWPGRSGAAAEVLPPSWVPAFPPRLESMVAAAGAAGTPAAWQPQRTIGRRLGTGALLGALAVSTALALHRPLSLERLIGIRAAGPSVEGLARAEAVSSFSQLVPTLRTVNQDAAGSSIDAASYRSVALGGAGSFLVYLPPGYASTTRHYPVLYLLHGHDQLATAFLQVGLQGELDRLIARHAIPPLIAVMIQGGRGSNNWRDSGAGKYESYVLEVQKLMDRTLPTVAERGGRVIAGVSMGGYGAMNVALSHPDRFATVESWLGFFNGLDGKLRADRPLISRIGLRAFVYGGSSDRIADPSENAPFAAALKAAGARAHSAVYPGGHSLETVEAHLESMLVFAGRALSQSPKPASKPRPGRPLHG